MIKGSEVDGQPSVYPREWHEEGTALVLFDTVLAHESSPAKKVEGDANMTGSTPTWIDFNSQHCGLRWPYTEDASEGTLTTLRALSSECYTPWTGVEFTGKKLAGDGESCGMNLDWEF